MSYVLLSADFPGVTGQQRNEIYECLAKKNWHKIVEPGRDISTTWQGYFKSVTESEAIEIAKNHFVTCASPYCKPKLVIHWGPNEPTYVGLT